MPTPKDVLAGSSHSHHDGNDHSRVGSDILNGETVEGEEKSSAAKKATDAYEYTINDYSSSDDDDN